MKKRVSVLCLVLLAFGSIVIPAAAEEAVSPPVSPSPLPDDLYGSCTRDSVSNSIPSIPLGLPEWLDASGCCPRTCNINSDCDASCGQGFGQCKWLGTCCSFCLCSLGGS